jgi:hypothetical protein
MAVDSTPLINAKRAAERYHGKIPYVRKLPAAVVGIILAVAVVNAMVWTAVGVVLVSALPSEYRGTVGVVNMYHVRAAFQQVCLPASRHNIMPKAPGTGKEVVMGILLGPI